MRQVEVENERLEEVFLVIQTPVGLLKIAIGPGANLPEPVARAVAIFQRVVDSGSSDPMGETLEKLQQMASLGDEEPLAASMAFINEQVAKHIEDYKQAQKQGKESVLTRLEKPHSMN